MINDLNFFLHYLENWAKLILFIFHFCPTNCVSLKLVILDANKYLKNYAHEKQPKYGMLVAEADDYSKIPILRPLLDSPKGGL